MGSIFLSCLIIYFFNLARFLRIKKEIPVTIITGYGTCRLYGNFLLPSVNKLTN